MEYYTFKQSLSQIQLLQGVTEPFLIQLQHRTDSWARKYKHWRGGCSCL